MFNRQCLRNSWTSYWEDLLSVFWEYHIVDSNIDYQHRTHLTFITVLLTNLIPCYIYTRKFCDILSCQFVWIWGQYYWNLQISKLIKLKSNLYTILHDIYECIIQFGLGIYMYKYTYMCTLIFVYVFVYTCRMHIFIYICIYIQNFNFGHDKNS